jgi:hypothetical protein
MGYYTYDGYQFATTRENSVENSTSKVDYVALVDDEAQALCEANLPLVMKKAGDLLLPHSIGLIWICGQILMPKILTKVSMPIPVSYNISFKETCVGSIVSGSEMNGMAVSYLPQLLDCVLSCEG